MAYKFLVICPLLYVGGISARARLHVDPYTFVSCTHKQHEAIAAYREPFIAAASFKGIPAKDVNQERLRQVADQWIQGADEGKLQALTPVHLDDFIRDGVKQQIYRANDLLVQLLISNAKRDMAPSDAAKDLIRAIQVADVLKFSDPYAVAQSGIHQRTALQELSRLSTDLTPGERLWVRDQLRTVRANQPSLEPMVRLLYRLHLEADGESAGKSSLRSIRALLQDPGKADRDSLTVLASLPRPSYRNKTTESPVLGLLRMSGIAQEHWLSSLEREIEALGTTLVVGDPQDHRLVAAAP